MQALVDMMDSFTGVVRLVILAIFGFGVIVTLVMTFSFSVVAPQVADNYAERAEAFGDRAIEAAREEARARDLAEEGWGYDDRRSGAGSSTDADGDTVGGWADDGR